MNDSGHRLSIARFETRMEDDILTRNADWKREDGARRLHT